MLKETLQISSKCGATTTGPRGTHYRSPKHFVSKADSTAAAPDLIGGEARRRHCDCRSVRRRVEHQPRRRTPDETRRKLDVLNRHCDDVAVTRRHSQGRWHPRRSARRRGRFVSSAADTPHRLISSRIPCTLTDPVGFVSRLGDEVVPILAQVS